MAPEDAPQPQQSTDKRSMIALIVVDHDFGSAPAPDALPDVDQRIRVFSADLNEDQVLSGKLLAEMIVSHYLSRASEDTVLIPKIVEVYDPTYLEYRPLNHPELIDIDIRKRLGSRFRARLCWSPSSRPSAPIQKPNLLAIQGRFYAYDGGITIQGEKIEVQELPNDNPGRGTAGNVWDGAVLL